jgi:hypothetical protein
MAPPVPRRRPGWLNLRQASLQLGRSPTVTLRLAVIGKIRVRLASGSLPLYSAEDVERIAGDPHQQDGRSRSRKAPGGGGDAPRPARSRRRQQSDRAGA